MKLVGDAVVRIEVGKCHVHFPIDGIEVEIGPLAVASDHGGAGAKPAERLTEWQVVIE